MANNFEYLRPTTMGEAVDMKSSHGARAQFWAGGTDMMLQWKAGITDFDYCIDLTYVPDLDQIALDGDQLRIVAMATLDDLDLQSGLHPLTEALGETARMMCTKQTRTLATIGGNLCNASPSADLSPPLAAMGAQARILGPDGERTIPLTEFFTGVRKTALADGEMLTEIVVPDVGGDVAASYNRVARTVVDIALVSSAAFIKLDSSGKITKAGVALGAVAPTVVRVNKAEDLLIGCSLKEAANGVANKAGEHAIATANAITDIRASKEYRTDMTSVLTQRAIGRCVAILEGNG